MRKAIEKAVDDSLRAAIDNGALDEAIERITLKRMQELIAFKPNHRLTTTGYVLAFAATINHHWPDVPIAEASAWCREELGMAGIKAGDARFQWTPAAARDQATEYTQTYGEVSA